MDVNCVDSLGRGALCLSIDSENLEMVKLLVVMGIETKDALLRAIDQEFVEAVEFLLEHEELLTANSMENNCEWYFIFVTNFYLEIKKTIWTLRMYRKDQSWIEPWLWFIQLQNIID